MKDGNGLDPVVVNEYLANPEFIRFLEDGLVFEVWDEGLSGFLASPELAGKYAVGKKDDKKDGL